MSDIEHSQELTPADRALVELGTMLREGGYHFITPTPLTHARVNARPGGQRARTLADVFGWSRPFDSDLVPAPMRARMQAAGVLAPAGEAWRSAVRLSSLDDQLFFHSAYPTTSADAVFFGPDTYRFATAIRHRLAAGGVVERALDIGCGAGPGGILIAAAHPNADVVLGDINDAALRLSRVNAALNGTHNAVAQHSNLLGGVDGNFDLIVSNPPYLIDAGERAYRHGGGKLGEGLSVKILEAALPRLSSAGTLLLYTGSAIVDGVDGFREAAEAILGQTDREWSYSEMDPDVFGEELESGPYATADRIAAVVLTVR